MKLQILLVVVAFITHDLRSYPADRDDSENDEDTNDAVTGSALLRRIDMVRGIDGTSGAPKDGDLTTPTGAMDPTNTIAAEEDAKIRRQKQKVQAGAALSRLRSLRQKVRRYRVFGNKVDQTTDPSGTNALKDDVSNNTTDPSGTNALKDDVSNNTTDPSGTNALKDDVSRLKTQVQQLQEDHKSFEALKTQVGALDQKVSELKDTVLEHIPYIGAPTKPDDQPAPPPATAVRPDLWEIQGLHAPPPATAKRRDLGGLLGDIQKGKALKKVGPPTEGGSKRGPSGIAAAAAAAARGGGGGGGGGGFKEIMRRNREAAAKKAAEKAAAGGGAAPPPAARRPVPPPKASGGPPAFNPKDHIKTLRKVDHQLW